MSVSQGSVKLRYALKKLRQSWDETEPHWQDKVREQFQSKRLTPLEVQTEAAVRAMHELAEVFAKARRELTDETERL